MSDELRQEGDGIRGTWFWDPEKRALVKKLEKPKKEVNAPYIITDEIPPTESYVDDKRRMFTSKAKLMQDYKDHGYICTGGERRKAPPPYKPDPEKVREDWLKACNDAKYGNVEMTEEQKERCRQEEREYQAWKRRNGLR